MNEYDVWHALVEAIQAGDGVESGDSAWQYVETLIEVYGWGAALPIDIPNKFGGVQRLHQNGEWHSFLDAQTLAQAMLDADGGVEQVAVQVGAPGSVESGGGGWNPFGFLRLPFSLPYGLPWWLLLLCIVLAWPWLRRMCKRVGFC